MARKKSPKKEKQLVKIRSRKLANGNERLYLDTYRNGERSFEFIDEAYIKAIPVDAPENVKADIVSWNEKVLTKVTAIRNQREIELLNGTRDVVSVEDKGKMLLMDWMDAYKEKSKLSHKGNGYERQVINVSNRLRDYLGVRAKMVQMKSVDEDLCRGFITYLKTAQMTTGKLLSGVTVYHYYSVFRNALKRAVAERIITFNPVERLAELDEVPERPEVERDYLSADEVRLMMKADCQSETVKRAFLFSCFVGLRISDILALKWESIKDYGTEKHLVLVTQKTGEPLNLPLSAMALKWLPERGKQNEKVFQDMPAMTQIQKYVRRWADAAGIVGKTVTFHTSRHAFAVMSLESGADIYTVSKMLTHKTIQTTTAYLKLLDKKTNTAVNAVSNRFSDML